MPGGTNVIVRGHFRRKFHDANFKGSFERQFRKKNKGNVERDLLRQFGWGAALPDLGELGPGTRLRLADVLTTALGHATTALDVGIYSPDAQNPGNDCVESVFQRKMIHYQPHFGALERLNIEYVPLIWGSYGRPHARCRPSHSLQPHCEKARHRMFVRGFPSSYCLGFG